MSRGFITIAAGDDSYYQMAYHLLLSYRYHTSNPLPFAIICDRENQWTPAFDHTIVCENMSKSYLDKLTLLSHTIYDETIFIDADCLAYRDLNDLFKYMPKNGVSCIGKELPLSDIENGWFRASDIGEYANRLRFIPQMHGGIIFFRNDVHTEKIYNEALHIATEYHKYKFKYFTKPADEPILALAISANDGHLIKVDNMDSQNIYVFYPSVKKVFSNLRKGYLEYINNQNLRIQNVYICHWQNKNTYTHPYIKDALYLSEANCAKRVLKSYKSLLRDSVSDSVTKIKQIILKFCTPKTIKC